MNDLSDQEIYEISNPIWERMISASNSIDYEKFSTHFSDALKSKISKDKFETQTKENQLLTTLVSGAIPLACIRRSEGVTVLYKQLSSELSEEFLGLLTLSKINEEYRVIDAQVN